MRHLFSVADPMTLEIQVGDPPVEGRYVVWTPCAALSAREWCEPSIATWHGGKWHFYDPVWGWIGPLPVVHGNDCLRKIETAPVEYDL
jgi:hypothetical protein